MLHGIFSFKTRLKTWFVESFQNRHGFRFLKLSVLGVSMSKLIGYANRPNAFKYFVITAT